MKSLITLPYSGKTKWHQQTSTLSTTLKKAVSHSPIYQLYLVPVPDHSSANPDALAILAQDICLELADCHTYPDLETGLEAAISNTSETSERLIVLCGSLYLVGYFLKQNCSSLSSELT